MASISSSTSSALPEGLLLNSPRSNKTLDTNNTNTTTNTSKYVEEYKLLLPLKWQTYDQLGHKSIKTFRHYMRHSDGRPINIEKEEAEARLHDHLHKGTRAKEMKELQRVFEDMQAREVALVQRKQMHNAVDRQKQMQSKHRQAQIEHLSERAKHILDATKPKMASWDPKVFQDAVALVCSGNSIHVAEVQAAKMNAVIAREAAFTKQRLESEEALNTRLTQRQDALRQTLHDRIERSVEKMTRVQSDVTKLRDHENNERMRTHNKEMEREETAAVSRLHQLNEVTQKIRHETTEALHHALTARTVHDADKEAKALADIEKWKNRVATMVPRPPPESSTLSTARTHTTTFPSFDDRLEKANKRKIAEDHADAVRLTHLYNKAHETALKNRQRDEESHRHLSHEEDCRLTKIQKAVSAREQSIKEATESKIRQQQARQEEYAARRKNRLERFSTRKAELENTQETKRDEIRTKLVQEQLENSYGNLQQRRVGEAAFRVPLESEALNPKKIVPMFHPVPPPDAEKALDHIETKVDTARKRKEHITNTFTHQRHQANELVDMHHMKALRAMEEYGDAAVKKLNTKLQQENETLRRAAEERHRKQEDQKKVKELHWDEVHQKYVEEERALDVAKLSQYHKALEYRTQHSPKRMDVNNRHE